MGDNLRSSELDRLLLCSDSECDDSGSDHGNDMVRICPRLLPKQPDLRAYSDSDSQNDEPAPYACNLSDSEFDDDIIPGTPPDVAIPYFSLTLAQKYPSASRPTSVEPLPGPSTAAVTDLLNTDNDKNAPLPASNAPQKRKRKVCECNCSESVPLDPLLLLEEDQLEAAVYMNFRLWHVIFMGFASVMAVVICVCCCVRFRIPRTKQEIEADYVRKKITGKFQKQLKLIQNTEMDEMDLKRALERVRAEFKSDTESLAHSEALSTSSAAAQDDSVFRKSSTANLGLSIDELIEGRNKGLGSKLASFVGFLRPRRSKQQSAEEKATKIGV